MRVRRTMGQSGKFCKETSPHCQYYLFEIKWFWCIHVGLLKSIRPRKVTMHWFIQIHQICVKKTSRIRITSSLRFLCIFDQSGLLCGFQSFKGCTTNNKFYTIWKLFESYDQHLWPISEHWVNIETYILNIYFILYELI